MDNWKNIRIKKLQEKLEERDEEILNLKYKIIDLEFENKNETIKYVHRNKITVPDGALEAVRYAMNKSHPDNGGKHEDFIKFRKLYEEMKGMKL